MTSKSRILSNLGGLLTTDNQVPTIGLTISGVAAGTYGSSSTVPVITVDDRGRVTLVSSADIAGSGGTLAISGGGTGATTAAGALTALGAYAASNPSGYISGITSTQVTTALGFTPYNAANPSGYITATGIAANVSGVVTIANGGTGVSTAAAALTALGAYAATNPSGYISSITNLNVLTALGYTPYNASNPSNYITSAGNAANVTGIVAVVNGGTGTATPGIVAGSNITVSGTWPNQTINSTASGSGSVTSVGLTVPDFLSVTNSPITGAGTLAVTYSGTALPVAYGGTGTDTPGLVAGTNITVTGVWPNQTIASTASGGTSTGTSGTYVTRTFTGDGTTVAYTVTSGITVDSALVTENGITQTPTTDYTVTGTTLTFTTAPAAGELIQIRELASGGGGASGAGNAYAWFLI